MMGARSHRPPRTKDEGEKPFWISFADLMTSLMVLFLLVMCVALTSVTKKVAEAAHEAHTRERDIATLIRMIRLDARDYVGVTVDEARASIDFGAKAHFESGSCLLSGERSAFLRDFVARVLLPRARQPEGQRWLKQVVVEGFADPSGSYLLNLNLSLLRSERVLCALLDPVDGAGPGLSATDQNDVAHLFLVGGYSSNSAKASFEASRRIQLRLEYYRQDERPSETPGAPQQEFGRCRI